MSAIHIRTTLTSDTLHLPELAPLIGRRVEITVVEEHSAYPPGWTPPTPEDIAAADQALKELRESDFDWGVYDRMAEAEQRSLAEEYERWKAGEGSP